MMTFKTAVVKLSTVFPISATEPGSPSLRLPVAVDWMREDVCLMCVHSHRALLIGGLHHRPLDAADVVGHLVDDRVLRPRLDAVLVILRISLGHLLEPLDEAVLNLSRAKTDIK